MKILIIVIIAILILGCTGKIYTVKNPVFKDDKIEGVLFYGYKAKEKKVVMDRIRHPKTGNITHSMYEIPTSKKYCAPSVKIKNIIVADYSTQYAIRYESGLFETNKFSVGLEKGMLKSVNSESTPGIKTAVESLQGLVDIREDILDKFVIASDQSAEKSLNNVMGILPQATPIKCSSNQ